MPWRRLPYNQLSDLHYDPTTGIFDFSTDIAHRPTLVTLGGVAILLLIIGSINFINLETAQALRRAKEVGVRKVLGSTRTRLIAQFVCEGMLLTLAAVLLALPFTELSLSTFSEFVPAGVRFDIVAMIPVLLFITVFIGVLASSYPAFILSGFLPAVVLKSQSQGSTSSGSAYMRKVLIIFQFTFAQVLILGTVLIGAQIQYVLNKDLGFRRDAVVYFRAPSSGTAEKVQALRNELETLPGMAKLALSDSPPADNGWSSSLIEYYVGNEKLTINAFRKFGDENYHCAVRYADPGRPESATQRYYTGGDHKRNLGHAARLQHTTGSARHTSEDQQRKDACSGRC